MNHCYAAYKSNGYIGLVFTTVPEEALSLAKLNGYTSFIETVELVDPKLAYVKDGELEVRPEQEYTLEGNILKGVPAGAVIRIDYADYTADGTDIELSFSNPGTHTITVMAWPYRDKEFTYEN